MTVKETKTTVPEVKHTFTLKNGNVFNVHIVDVQEEIENLPLEFWKSEIPYWNSKASYRQTADCLTSDWFKKFLLTPIEEYEKEWSLEKPSVEVFKEIQKIHWVWLPERTKIISDDVAVFWKIPTEYDGNTWLMRFGDTVNISNNVAKDWFCRQHEPPSSYDNQFLGKVTFRYQNVNQSLLVKTWNSRRNYVLKQESDFFKQRREVFRTQAMMEFGPQINDIRDFTNQIIELTQNGNLHSDDLGKFLKRLESFQKKVAPLRAKLT